MSEFTPADAGRLAQRVLFDEWRGLMREGWLPEAALLAIRTRLAFTSEFEAGPEREAMLLEVSDAVAAMRGIPPADMPGVPQVPDDVAGLG
jgi:hypothetical protein